MNFRVITSALTSLLGDSATGRYRVIGHQQQSQNAEEIKDNLRRVQCYYSNGSFPKSSGRLTGNTQHQLTFNIDLSVASAAKADLSVINNPASTELQIAAALAAMKNAESQADLQFDELAEIVYQILMDGRNFDLGLGKGVISNRWIESIQKDDTQPYGNLVTLTGRLLYTCQTSESITGDAGVIMIEGIGTVLDIVRDDVEKTGVVTGG